MAELAAAGLDPLGGLLQSVEASDPQCFTILADGVPCAIFGVTAGEGRGYPWMLGTDLMLTIPRDLMVQGLYWIDYLNRLHPFLENYVSEENTISIGWLTRMGFDFHETHDVNGTPFIRFTRGT